MPGVISSRSAAPPLLASRCAAPLLLLVTTADRCSPMRQLSLAPWLLLAAAAGTTAADGESNDRQALLAAFVRSGPAWASLRGWRDDAPDPTCTWDGVLCDSAGRVRAVDFRTLEHREALVYTLNGTGLVELRGLRELHLQNTGLSGTLPTEFASLPAIEIVRLSTTALSGTLPSPVRRQSLKYLDAHETFFEGTIPDFSGCTALEFLDLSSCSFTTPPRALPASLDHLYLNSNPLNTSVAALGQLLTGPSDLHNLEVSFLNAPVELVYPPKTHYRLGENGSGTRVIKPALCHIGDASCVFRLDLYDADNCHVHVGGLLFGLSLRYERPVAAAGEAVERFSTPFVDARNGSFTATINASWVDQQGPQVFQFFHGEREFRPTMTADNVAADSTELRTINYLPRICPMGSHTLPNSTSGAVCDHCKPRFVADPHSTASAGLTCTRECPGNDVSTSDGSGCECDGEDYDTSATGVVVCMSMQWSDPFADNGYLAAQQLRAQNASCAECPKQCASCANGVVELKQGWRLNATSDSNLATLLRNGQNGRLQVAFACPSKAACPPLRLVPPPSPDSGISVVVAEERTLTCAKNHTGALCGACVDGFSLKESDDSCSLCGGTQSSNVTFFGLSTVWFIVLLVLAIGLVLCGLWQLKAYRRLLEVLKEEVQTMAKIVLGQLQVLVLMRGVLNLVFPLQQQQAMNLASVFTLEVRRIAPAFDCLGWSWYVKWSLLTMGLPTVGFLCAGLLYLWRRRRGGDAAASAKRQAIVHVFLVVMVLYPQVSARIFTALRCRELGASMSILEADYRISCTDVWYGRVRVLAVALVFIWPFGIPGFVLWRMWCEKRHLFWS